MATSKDCVYCQKLAALDYLPPNELVWKFEYSVALLGPWQFYLGYCILAARTHATELNQLDDKARHGYFDEMCLLARAIQECFSPDKLNYELLGNQVPHLHWHLFPRSRSDPEAADPVWFAIERTKHNRKERERLMRGTLDNDAVVSTLRERLRQLTNTESDPK